MSLSKFKKTKIIQCMVCRPKKPDHNTIKLKINNRRKREREKEIESLFIEIMTENFPNLGSDLDIQIHEVTRFLNSTQRYIL